MLGRIILIALQIAIAWFAAPQVLRYVPVAGDVGVLVQSVAFGVIVWIVGLIGAQALKDVNTPSPGTLVWSVVLAAIGGVMVIYKVPAMITQATGFAIVPMFLPLLLAIFGYAIKK